MSDVIQLALMNLYQEIDHYPITACSAKERLIAVSKRQPVERLVEALEAGHRVFGENTLQEIEMKWPALRKEYSDVSIHFIGHIQSRKLESIIQHCDVIHSIDRLKLVEKLAQLKDEHDIPDLLLQVNIGREEQKSGCMPEDTAALLEECVKHELPVRGIMCIPPADEAPNHYFEQMATLQKQLDLPWLSMGMSGDYETALRCGATHIRIGTGVFGVRAY